jgi:hypothetical protein
MFYERSYALIKMKKKTDENAMEKNRIEMISTENFMINKYFSSQKFI